MPTPDVVGKAGRPTASVRIRTLGGFAVEVDSAPLASSAKGQRKPLVLLKALIALGGQEVVSEQLCESLWPDADGDRAQRAFAAALHRLRGLLGRDALRLAAGRLSLNPARCRVDALELQAHLDTARAAARNGGHVAAAEALDHALTLYCGPFLPGEFDPPEILAAREHLHTAVLRRVEETCNALAAAGQPERALALCHLALEVDPVAEELVRRIITLCRQQNRPAEGAAAYERCRELLRGTLASEPTPELRAAGEALRTAAASAPAQRAVPAAGLSDAAGPVHIAVRLFASRSGDEEQDYFCDGLTEDLVTDLSRIPRLAIVMHDTREGRAGSNSDAATLARTLRVRYVLDGSVRRSAGRVRVTARLFDAERNGQCWAERYDRAWGELLALQEDLTRHIVTALDVQLLVGEQALTWRRSTRNPDAYDRFLRARALWHLGGMREYADRAVRLLAEALELDPEFAVAAGRMAFVISQQVRFGWVDDRAATCARARTIAERALAQDPTEGNALATLINLSLTEGNHDEALEFARRLEASQPAGADILMLLGRAQLWLGEADKALPHFERARGLLPTSELPRCLYNAAFGHVLFWLGRLEESERHFLQAATVAPHMKIVHAFLVATYEAQRRHADAQASAHEVLRCDPGFSVRTFADDSLMYRKAEWRERMMGLLRAAGLPE